MSHQWTRDEVISIFHQAGLPIESEEHIARKVELWSEGWSYGGLQYRLVSQPLEQRLEVYVRNRRKNGRKGRI